MAAKQHHTKHAPAKTLEARENQLIAMAVDEAERQICAGTASSQVLTHFLKLASTKERVEKEIRVLEKELVTAKTNAIKSQQTQEELYEKAIKAMQRYAGIGPVDDYED